MTLTRGLYPDDLSGVQFRQAVCDYDFSVGGGAIGDIDLGELLPDNAIITEIITEETTPLTSLGAATVQLFAGPSATGQALTDAVAFDTGFNGVDILPIVTGSTAIKLTVAANATIEVAVADLTAGVIRFYISYIAGQ